jgi:hypothetical protein
MDFEDIVLDGIVSEMTADPAFNIPLDSARVQQILAVTKDDAPQFPILRVEEGTSNNGRVWDAAILEDVAEQINRMEPVGYLGHIKPEDDGYAFPKPQTIWLKAVTKKEGAKTVLYTKGYNFPNADARMYGPLGVTREASWRGKAALQALPNGMKRVTKFVLESIDWSRKGKAGMSARLVAIATEMEGSDKVDPKDIAALTVADLTAHNPNLIELIKRDATVEQQTRISEMEQEAEQAKDGLTLLARVRETLGLKAEDDPVAAIVSAQEELDKINRRTLHERLADILSKKVKNESARKTVLRLLPVSEMENLDDAALEAKVVASIDSDDEIKAIISEMEQTPVRPGRGSQSSGGNGKGYQPKSGSVRASATKL